jgi:hypothetical protein
MSAHRVLTLAALLAACGPATPPDADDSDAALPTDTPVDTPTDTPAVDDTPEDTPAVDTSWYDDASSAPACEIGAQVLADAGPPAVYTFVPVEAGATFEVEKGNQGLWHIYASVRCHNVVAGDGEDPRDPTNPVVSWTVVSTTGDLLAGYQSLPRPMDLFGTGAARLHHEILVWRVGVYEDAIHRDASLQFTLRDASGATVETSLPIRLEPWPGYVPPTPPAAP